MTDEEALAGAWAMYRAEFERCSEWLAAALDRFPIRTHTLEHVWADIVAGKAVLWPTPNSACVTQIDSYPTGVKVVHGWLAGGDLNEIKQTVAKIEAFAKEHGCAAASIMGRRGWLKAFNDYRDAGTLMTKELT